MTNFYPEGEVIHEPFNPPNYFYSILRLHNHSQTTARLCVSIQLFVTGGENSVSWSAIYRGRNVETINRHNSYMQVLYIYEWKEKREKKDLDKKKINRFL